MKKQKTVLLAFSGGKKSTVAAYLLLKQGYSVTACSFLMGGLESSCTLSDLGRAQDICKLLGIGHITIDLQSEFNEKVISPLIAARLSGEDFYPCYNCNVLKIEALLKRANEKKFDFIASGHIANLIKEPSGYKVFQAKELEYDQSFFISGLRENTLGKLLLPLGKLTHNEINKISASLNLGMQELREPRKKCIQDKEKIIATIEQQVPLSLRPEGLIVEADTGVACGQHTGFYNFRIGDKVLNSLTSGKSDNFFVVGFNDNKKTIMVRENATFIQNQMRISTFNPFLDINLSVPLNCHLAMEHGDGKIPCKIYLENNGYAIVQMGRSLEGPIENGSLVVFYEVNDEVSRVIATGFVCEIGEFINKPKEEGYYIN